ncbi:MAG: 16S rRNA (guanine(527)-N(7))-methyltransferase RsmG [Candidatus Sericytochromatia bacterium]|jgi:16S rRNA (guanine527-N7)-methyltransferase|nr:16S rRNA (guanine(527)-N(7))-methyltransferase RsmG [Candidatus Sericytochromatia bacterium]
MPSEIIPIIQPEWRAKFEAFYQALMKANQMLNLTRVTDEAEFESKHLQDSVTLLDVLPADPGLKILDLGTGGGVPGIPLWLMRPDWQLTLLDSVGKKVRAVEQICKELQAEFPEELKQIPTCLQGRAEVLGRDKAHRESYDVVVCRAVATLPVLIEYALPLLKRGGKFIAMKGPSYQDEMADITVAAGILGGRLAEPYLYTLPPDLQRVLVIFEKRSLTPHVFPRKDSNLRKKPITQMGKEPA